MALPCIYLTGAFSDATAGATEVREVRCLRAAVPALVRSTPSTVRWLWLMEDADPAPAPLWHVRSRHPMGRVAAFRFWRVGGQAVVSYGTQWGPTANRQQPYSLVRSGWCIGRASFASSHFRRHPSLFPNLMAQLPISRVLDAGVH